MQQGYPILLDVSNRLIVIVGGGSVAVRKAAGVLDAGATRVRVVAPEIDPQMPPPVERIKERYSPQRLAGAALVFAATNSRDVNDAVTRDARTRGILVNQADDPSISDFATPAQLKRGPVTIAVSASSPALSVFIRDAISKQFDDRWRLMAEAMQTLRPELQKDEAVDNDSRHRLFRKLASEEAMTVLAAGGIDALRQWIAK
jgi:precorrin-2 dehydrogenase/sirohydrochlorin ferrochelatase